MSRRSLLAIASAVALLFVPDPAQAQSAQSAQGVIYQVDPYIPSAFWVRVRNFSNPSCDENRLQVEFADQNYQAKLFAMALTAYHTGAPVYFQFSIVGDQCKVTRMILTGTN